MAVQAEDGRRAMGQFALDSTLQAVLDTLGKEGKLALPEESPQLVPVVILATNAEIRGHHALRDTSLKGLGFAAGKRELLKLKFVDLEKEKRVRVFLLQSY